MIFEYQPFDADGRQIRLLCIKPRKSENIRCQLENFSIDDCPAYKALSYTWEPKYPRRQIFVNGSRFEIGENLFQLLCQIWEQQGDYFWIDQVCINQANIYERNHQVTLMGEIYRKATETIIWLGVENNDSDKAIDFVQSLSSPSGAALRNMSVVPCRPLKMLFMRPYWRRLWIIQEVMLAHQILVICGSKKIQWEKLHNFYIECKESSKDYTSNFYSPGELISASFRTILTTKQQWGFGDQWKAPKQSLSQVLSTFTRAECQDFHDKIYGLLALVTDEYSFSVDYACTGQDLLRDVLVEAKNNGKHDVNHAVQLGMTVGRNLGFNYTHDLGGMVLKLAGEIYDIMPIELY
jgi:Heterokaryon incompatibility protein (HET)